MGRRRIDLVLVERGLFESRSKAAAAVMAGIVVVGRDGERAQKAGQLVDDGVELAVAGGERFVSRGGTKLENALRALPGVEVAGRDCLDAGASTGGFTDCLLRHGARHVVAVDVAYGEFHWSLRNDPRVTLIERRNVRELTRDELPYTPSLIVADLSFISVAKALPALAACASADFDMLALVKPQFEVGRERVGKGGVVRDPAHRRAAVEAVAAAGEAIGLAVNGIASSGLPGPAGNRETFVWFARGSGARPVDVVGALDQVEPVA